MGCAGSKNARSQDLGTPGAPPTPVAQAQQSKQAGGTLTRELPPHFGPEALLASVESGAIAPLRGSWVVALHERGGKLQRRQDLPPEAFFTATELRELVAKLGDDYGLLFVALSYRWLTKDHPDPEAFHLRIVAEVAKLYMHTDKDRSPLTAAFASKGLGTLDFALFWDFASLYQKPRSEEQERLFLRGLRASNVWYGHELSVCWMQKELPKGFAQQMQAAGLAEDYETSGWCFVEAAISAGLKMGTRRLDLAKRTQQAMGHAYGSRFDSDYMLEGVCAASREPPLLPDEVFRLLRDEKKFTSRADIGTVDKLYRTFFDGASSSAQRLTFGGLKWGAAEARQLVDVLPRFVSLTSLDVSKNEMGVDGGKIIAEYVKFNQTLTSLNLGSNFLKDEGAGYVAEALKINTTLKELNLSLNQIGGYEEEDGYDSDGDEKTKTVYTPEGPAALASALKQNSSLTALSLEDNKVGDPGAQALSEALKTNSALQTLNLRGNDVGKHLAEALKANSTLQTLDLANNNLTNYDSDMSGVIKLAEALKTNSCLRELNLGINLLKDEGAGYVVEALKINTTLKELNLGYNLLKDEGAGYVAEALKINTTLRELNLEYNNIQVPGAKALGEALAMNKSLTSLNVCNNNITGDGADSLAKVVLEHNSLTDFCSIPLVSLRENSVMELDLQAKGVGVPGAIVLSRLMPAATALKSLNLERNGIKDVGAKALGKALTTNKSLTSLNLSENQLCGLDEDGEGEYTAEGIIAISAMLKVNGSLQSINLEYNALGDVGAKHVADAIATNTTLKELNLYENGVGKEGAEHLAEALKMNSTLQTLDVRANGLNNNAKESLRAAAGDRVKLDL